LGETGFWREVPHANRRNIHNLCRQLPELLPSLLARDMPTDGLIFPPEFGAKFVAQSNFVAQLSYLI
jgi:hypothetical protein